MSYPYPVVVIGFNRPDVTARLVSRLEPLKPTTLFVIVDGPRAGVSTDFSRVAAVIRQFDRLPWSCDIYREYAQTNLGCARRVESGLDWVFNLTEKAVVLEDDCLPMPCFFRFAGELLEHYAHDASVASICGVTHRGPKASNAESYRFSRYPLIWGWASWRRAWIGDGRRIDYSDAFVQRVLSEVFSSQRARRYWRGLLQKSLRAEINTWDYLWAFRCWERGMRHILPAVSLVENTGIGPEATHTKKAEQLIASAQEMDFPLVHPADMRADQSLDDWIEDTVFSKSVANRLKWAAKTFFQ